ncbi:hypothetical protein D3C79_981410 [compost metagenome]
MNALYNANQDTVGEPIDDSFQGAFQCDQRTAENRSAGFTHHPLATSETVHPLLRKYAGKFLLLGGQDIDGKCTVIQQRVVCAGALVHADQH